MLNINTGVRVTVMNDRVGSKNAGGLSDPDFGSIQQGFGLADTMHLGSECSLALVHLSSSRW
jgi:hypothetical protein